MCVTVRDRWFVLFAISVHLEISWHYYMARKIPRVFGTWEKTLQVVLMSGFIIEGTAITALCNFLPMHKHMKQIKTHRVQIWIISREIMYVSTCKCSRIYLGINSLTESVARQDPIKNIWKLIKNIYSHFCDCQLYVLMKTLKLREWATDTNCEPPPTCSLNEFFSRFHQTQYYKTIAR